MPLGEPLSVIVKRVGYCCEFGWCNMMQRKELRGLKRLSIHSTASKLDVSPRTISNARRRFDRGEMLCEGLETCQKHVWKDKEPPKVTFSYAYTLRLASNGQGADSWLITFRDFSEIKEYVPVSHDYEMAAALVLTDAIEARIKNRLVVPFPSRAWEGDRLVATTPQLAERMMDYHKFFMNKNKDKV